jgi:retron-type reverse transcriptase
MTRAYFTAATMMDGNLRLPAIFFIITLPRDSGISNRSSFKVFSRKFVCQLPEKMVCCSGKGYTKTLTHRLVASTPERYSIVLGAVRSVLRCHYVSYHYITSSLEAKVIPSIAKNAGYRLTGSIVNNFKLIGKQRNSYCNTPKELLQEKQTLVCLETHKKYAYKRNTSFRFGASAILETRSVLAGTEEKTNQLSGQRGFSIETSKKIRDSVSYFKSINELIEQIGKGVWPKGQLATNMELELAALQKEICTFSLTNQKEVAMRLVEKYVFSVAVRFVAIRKIREQSETVKKKGVHSYTLRSDSECLYILKLSSWKNRFKWPQYEVKQVEISKHGAKRKLGIGSILDRVLQTAFHSLMDPYFEGEFPTDMYGFRKGRDALQAVGLLKHITEQSRNNELGILLLNIDKCFDSINHQYIINVFDHPRSFSFLIIRWLKPHIRSQDGRLIERKQCGVAQGSIIGPLICNVVLMRLLYRKNKQDKERAHIFDSLKQTVMVNGKPRHINRYLIFYADDILVTTTFPDEINSLFEKIKRELSPGGLSLNSEKSSLMDLRHYHFKKLEFDYLGFHFLYVSTIKLRKGGIISSNDKITDGKNFFNLGTFLVYVSNKNFMEVKNKCAIIMRKVTRLSVLEVIDEVNSVLLDHSRYFAWSNSYNRLKTLEGLLFKTSKKYIFRKFKNEGRNSPVWVAHKFFICGKKLFCKHPVSPYGLSWHLHVKLSKTQDYVNKNKDNSIKRTHKNIKRFEDYLFLVFPTKVYKMLPIKLAALSKNMKSMPYYTNPTAFIKEQTVLMAKRSHNKN